MEEYNGALAVHRIITEYVVPAGPYVFSLFTIGFATFLLVIYAVIEFQNSITKKRRK